MLLLLFSIVPVVEFLYVYYATEVIIKNLINKKCKNPEYGLNGCIRLLLFSLLD